MENVALKDSRDGDEVGLRAGEKGREWMTRHVVGYRRSAKNISPYNLSIYT